MASTDADDPILRRLEALEKATEKRLDDARDIHRREHDAAAQAHEDLHRAHESSHASVHATALESGQQFLSLYEQRWAAEKDARDLARQSVDKRLEQMNEFRSQLQSQAATFVTVAAHEATTRGIQARLEEQAKTISQRFVDVSKHTDDRYEDNRKRIEALEKGDVKQEGRALGQGATVAVIIGAISLVGAVLGIIVVLANFATGNTP